MISSALKTRISRLEAEFTTEAIWELGQIARDVPEAGPTIITILDQLSYVTTEDTSAVAIEELGEIARGIPDARSAIINNLDNLTLVTTGFIAPNALAQLESLANTALAEGDKSSIEAISEIFKDRELCSHPWISIPATRAHRRLRKIQLKGPQP